MKRANVVLNAGGASVVLNAGGASVVLNAGGASVVLDAEGANGLPSTNARILSSALNAWTLLLSAP